MTASEEDISVLISALYTTYLHSGFYPLLPYTGVHILEGTHTCTRGHTHTHLCEVGIHFRLIVKESQGLCCWFWTVSGSPCWPGADQVAMGLELLTLLLLLPSQGDYRHMWPCLELYGAWDQIQSCFHARQAVYHLPYIPHPDTQFKFKKACMCTYLHHLLFPQTPPVLPPCTLSQIHGLSFYNFYFIFLKISFPSQFSGFSHNIISLASWYLKFWMGPGTLAPTIIISSISLRSAQISSPPYSLMGMHLFSFMVPITVNVTSYIICREQCKMKMISFLLMRSGCANL